MHCVWSVLQPTIFFCTDQCYSYPFYELPNRKRYFWKNNYMCSQLINFGQSQGKQICLRSCLAVLTQNLYCILNTLISGLGRAYIVIGRQFHLALHFLLWLLARASTKYPVWHCSLCSTCSCALLTSTCASSVCIISLPDPPSSIGHSITNKTT